MKITFTQIPRVLIFLCTLWLFVSCKPKLNPEVIDLQVKTVESVPITEAMDLLLIEAENDVELLCRILKCAPSTYNRLRKGESAPTSMAETEIRELLKNTYKNGDDYLHKTDPEDRWFEKLRRFVDSIMIWQFILVFGSLGFVLGFCGAMTLAAYLEYGVIIIVFLLRFVIYYPFYWLTSTPVVADNFTNSIDTVWEILK